MRVAALIAAMTALLAATPVRAYDATEASIVGLRLGMAADDATLTLRRQGFAVTHDHGALVARTRDGQLSVNLTDDGVIRQIRYTFTGNGVNEASKIQDSVLDRFGPPDQGHPMEWCRMLKSDGTCPNTAPSLTFLPDTLTMLLQAGAERP